MKLTGAEVYKIVQPGRTGVYTTTIRRGQTVPLSLRGFIPKSDHKLFMAPRPKPEPSPEPVPAEEPADEVEAPVKPKRKKTDASN